MIARAFSWPLVLLFLVTGCPKRFDPRAQPLPSSADPGAERAFREAQNQFARGDFAGAQSQFAQFAETYRTDPLVLAAHLGEAQASFRLGQIPRARQLVDQVTQELAELPAAQQGDSTAFRDQLNYIRGLVSHRTGDCRRARELLRPFVRSMNSGDDVVEIHAVLADCALRADDLIDAANEYELYFRSARPIEKLYIRDRWSDTVRKLDPSRALALWNTLPHDTVAAAYLALRIADDRREASDEGGAQDVLRQTRGGFDRIGMDTACLFGKRGCGDAPAAEKSPEGRLVRAVGCLFPFSGKGRALGDRALRGAMLAADVLAADLPGAAESMGSAGPLELRLRDTGSDAAKVQDLVRELSREPIVAIIGPPDRQEAGVAAEVAVKLGIPLVQLTGDDSERGAGILKLVRSKAQIASSMVQHAAQSGARSAALLAPDSTYGKTMAQAISDATRTGNLRITVDIRYPENTTSFADQAKRIKATGADVLFVLAPAAQLALVAPQLVASNVTKMPGVRQEGRQAQLYATAEGMTVQLYGSMAKYLQGAIVASTFLPDMALPSVGNFLDRYRTSFGEEPNSLDALAYDAVRAVRIALDHLQQGRRRDELPTRAELVRELGHVSDVGLSGELSFGASGERAGFAPLYKITSEGAKPISVR